MRKLLTEDELIRLNDDWEEEYDHSEMTDAEWEMKRWLLIAQAQLKKLASTPDRVAIQRLWCQHCKALQKSNDTIVECLYNQLEHGREDAFCAANIDAVTAIIALIPSEEVVRQERERIQAKLVAEHWYGAGWDGMIEKGITHYFITAEDWESLKETP